MASTVALCTDNLQQKMTMWIKGENDAARIEHLC